MDVCIIACYYTDVTSMPDQRLLVSDISVFTITARWLLLSNFNRRTVANAVHRGDTSGMYNGDIVIEHLAVA